jgi:hypothetical protein
MLVQPALITHLLCRPVSNADSMVPRSELQVLCGMGTVWYVFSLPHSGMRKSATPSFPIPQKSRALNQILHGSIPHFAL